MKRLASLTAAVGLAAGVMVSAGTAQAIDMTEENSGLVENSLGGSTISGSANDMAVGSQPFTDFLAMITSKIRGFIPGPFVGSSGHGSSEEILGSNKRPY